jgi:hypothetical protein
MNLEQLNGRDFGQEQTPGIASPQIQLLKVLVE